MLNIEQYKSQICGLCESLPVKRLGLFGSSLTSKFSTSSDVDVLVLFDEKENIDYFDQYFELKSHLEGIFNRTVDLVMDKKFNNPYFQKVVDRTRRTIYER